jgi:hypothetical protein
MEPNRSAMCYSTAEVSERSSGRSRSQFMVAKAFLALVALASTPNISRADEGGVSFWVPGFFGSMAATPQQPGWSLATIYYHTDVSASGNTAVSREITIGQFNPTLNASINANVAAKADLGFLAPSYVFATPFLGGQASTSLLAAYGRNDTTLNATLSGMLGPIPFTRQINITDTTTAFGDLVPQFAVRWNAGVNNYMTYITGDIPVGKYNSNDLANLGLGHGAIDGGVGYTYFDPKTGNEFSATFGLTGNFKNQSTGYTNGIDSHLDLGTSKFVTKQLQLGLVGYYYQQLTADSGCAPVLCPFRSRVAGVGPQIGYLFPVGNMQGYLNLKAYKEFDAENRADGWNVWLTFVLSPAAAAAESKPSPIVTK